MWSKLEDLAVERVDVIQEGSPWKEEHLARYFYAKNLVKDQVVLDIACGTGFGSEFIAKCLPKEVHSVDVSDEAIVATQLKLRDFENTFVSKQDGTALNYEDKYFDVIFSIETIEHVQEDEAFIKELSRVLKPEGKLIISTPNGAITNPNGGNPANPFHVREYTPVQFKDLINPYFRIEFMAGQMVDKSYGVAPFLPSFNSMKLSFNQRLNKMYWSIALRMPFRDVIHKLLFGHSFYPVVEAYTFLKEDIERAHVQYYYLSPI